MLAERLCEAKYSELYPPEGALIKRWAPPVCKCALPTSEDLYLDSEKGMMVFSSGRCAPCSLASSIEDSTSRPSELRKRTLVLVLGQVVLTEPLRFRLGHPMDHSNAAGSSLVASLPEMRTAHALACPLMGYVCICWEVIAARIRSLNPVGLGTGTRIPVSHRKPLLGHSRAFERGLDL